MIEYRFLKELKFGHLINLSFCFLFCRDSVLLIKFYMDCFINPLKDQISKQSLFYKLKMTRYSVLLPVYNEIENLPLILYMLYETSVNQYFFYLCLSNFNFEIIIIEDNSPDKTRDMTKKLIKFYQKTT